jgi:hypothetical protein
MAFTIKDLPKKFDPSVILRCDECGSEYSSDARDYWDLEPSDPLYCACGNCLSLVQKSIVIRRLPHVRAS